MNGLSCGEESMTIFSAVLIGCQRVTDGRTDVKPIAITCFSIADARKNLRACFSSNGGHFEHNLWTDDIEIRLIATVVDIIVMTHTE